MPTYEYLCKTCGHRFDNFQSITSDALTHCLASECPLEDKAKKGTGEVQRIISGGAGLVFKGEGFYLTDYARKGKSDTSGSNTNSPTSSSSSSDSSTPSGNDSSSVSSASDSSSTSTSGNSTTSGGKSSGGTISGNPPKKSE